MQECQLNSKAHILFYFKLPTLQCESIDRYAILFIVHDATLTMNEFPILCNLESPWEFISPPMKSL